MAIALGWLQEVEINSLLLKTVCISDTGFKDPCAGDNLKTAFLSWYQKVLYKLPKKESNQQSYPALVPMDPNKDQHGIITLKMQQ